MWHNCEIVKLVKNVLISNIDCVYTVKEFVGQLYPFSLCIHLKRN